MTDRDRRLLRRLRRDHDAARRRLWTLGAGRTFAAIASSVVVAAVVVGAPYEAAPSVRRAVLVLLGLGAVVAGLAWILRPLRAWGGLPRAARRVDGALGLRNALVVVEERARSGRSGPDAGLDAALHDRLTAGLDERYTKAPAPETLGLPSGARLWLPVLGALATAAIVLLGGGDAARLGFARLASPSAVLAKPLTYSLSLTYRAPTEPAGADAILLAEGAGNGPREAVCEVRTRQGAWRPLAVAVEEDGERLAYRAELRDVREDVVYRFRRGRVTTPDGTIRVLHAPLLSGLRTMLEPPAYTGVPATRHEPTPGFLEAPVGSRVVWEGRSSRPIVAATLRHADGDSTVCTLDGDDLRAEHVLIAGLGFTVDLADADGLHGGGGVRYELRAIPDEAPTVRLGNLHDDVRVPPDGRLSLALAAADDYGLSGPEVQFRRTSRWGAFADSTWSSLRVASPGGRREAGTPDGPVTMTTLETDGDRDGPSFSARLALEFGAVDLLPGDVLEVRARVRDNREPGPAGRGRSGVLRFTVPSAEDLLVEQVETADERMDSLEGMKRRGEAIAEELARLERELSKNPETDFARRQELEDALERQDRLQDELQSTVDDLRGDLDRMAERNVASPELLEKMDRVSELLEEVQDEELRRLQERLREAMGELSPEEIREAMQEVSERQDEFLERLDRAIALLEDLRKEQELAAVTAQVEEMMRAQEELAAAADSSASRESGSDASDDARRADRQDALADELAALEETLGAMGDALEAEPEAERSAAAEAMRKALEEALRELEEGGAEETMREAARNMESRDGDAGDSGDAQHESLRRLASLYSVLMNGQQAMQAAMEQFVAEALKHLAHDLLTVSARQEALAVRIPAELQDVHAAPLSREEMAVLRTAVALRERLTEILHQSPSLSAKLLGSLDDVIDGLDETVGQITDGWGRVAADSARGALGDLNRIVINLLTSPQMSGSGGGSCPMPSLGQQLEQMAREQAGLNGLTQQMGPRNGRGLSEETRARMERLPSDQQGLAGRMHDAAEQERATPEGERLLGDLEELARDMERVADDLSSGRVDEDVLRRQERILSRLLDARNSVRRRDYERRRESTGSDDVYRLQVGGASGADVGAEREALSVRRRRMEHVPPDYRDLVRRYFRSLPGPVRPNGETMR